MDQTSFGIHIALSKYPLGSEDDYITGLTNLYTKYRQSIQHQLDLHTTQYSGAELVKYNEDSKAYIDNLYQPSIFHVYSHFDIAFISLIDNFKFPQRVFEPWLDQQAELSENAQTNLRSVSYQILSGCVLETSSSEELFQILKTKNQFVEIIQLKINNGLLIGNGNSLIDVSLEKIKVILSDNNIKDYIFVESYNWSELILILFNENPINVISPLIELRELSLFDIKDDDVVNNIKKHSLYEIWEYNNIENCHLFSDSFSFLGVDYSNYHNIDPELNFKTEIEWQIKPGHFSFFINLMKESPLDIQPDFRNIYFKNGRTDYYIREKEPEKLLSNILIDSLIKKPESQIRNHIRRVKTKPLFELSEKTINILLKNGNSSQNHGSSNEKLNEYSIKNTQEVSGYLKKLNISRNIRKKVSKVIYNYHLGIHDPVLFIYFIDLHKPIQQLVRHLKVLSDLIQASLISGVLDKKIISKPEILKTKFIEDLIEAYISVFEEALEDRILNNYNYEDINEFSLDINSSLTSLVSSIDAIVKFYGECFRTGSKQKESILTTINDNETSSNKISVNYNIEHITSPPLIFSTLLKEILNVELIGADENKVSDYATILIEFLQLEPNNQNELRKISKEIFNEVAFNYFVVDYKKYYLTFFEETELYTFWHWVYALQCTHLYSSVGYYDEVNFTRELFRLLLLLNAVNEKNISSLRCPIPELRCYWDRHFNRLNKIAIKISALRNFKDLKDKIQKEVYESIFSLTLDGFSETDKKSNSEEKPKEKIDTYASVIRNYNITQGRVNEIVGVSRIDFSKKVNEELGKLIFESIDGESKKYRGLNKSQLYRLLSIISMYNLTHVQEKFKGQFSLLRRNYKTGAPIDHFLKNDTQWFIDPFGGFFINNHEERKDFMKFNNQMLSLLRHIGILLKKDLFK